MAFEAYVRIWVRKGHQPDDDDLRNLKGYIGAEYLEFDPPVANPPLIVLGLEASTKQQLMRRIGATRRLSWVGRAQALRNRDEVSRPKPPARRSAAAKPRRKTVAKRAAPARAARPARPSSRRGSKKRR